MLPAFNTIAALLALAVAIGLLVWQFRSGGRRA